MVDRGLVTRWDGSQVTVDFARRSHDYAMHRSIAGDKSPGWTITHIPTGHAVVGWVRLKGVAELFLDVLAEHGHSERTVVAMEREASSSVPSLPKSDKSKGKERTQRIREVKGKWKQQFVR